MEGKTKKPHSGATGSSIVDDLFGPKDAATASPSTAGYFSTVFPTSSAAMGKDRRSHDGGKPSSLPGGQPQQSTLQHGGSPESSYYGSSSVHYGARDFYAAADRDAPAPSKSNTAAQGAPPKHKDGGDTSAAATRGDWWQGSLYY